MLSQSTQMPRPAASPPDFGHQPRVRYAQSINPDAKTGGKSSSCLASNPESGMLSQSTRMPRPAASPPDVGHPTQSQVCSVNQPGCQDRRQVFQMPGIQPRVRYAQSINPDAKTGGKSSRRRASNPELSMPSHSTRMPRPVASPPDAGIQPRVRYAQSLNPDAMTGGKSSRCQASNPESGMVNHSTQMPRPAARVRYAQSINPNAKKSGKSSGRRASNPESGMLSQSTQMPRLTTRHPAQSQVCSVTQHQASNPESGMINHSTQMPRPAARVRYAQSINPNAKTGGKSSRPQASKPESSMLSQSTRMPRPAASPPDPRHLTQS
jgi:hypothetical protein